MNEDELTKLAAEELLKEAARGKQRYETAGVLGWTRPNVHPVNKQFLRRTIQSTLTRKRKPTQSTDKEVDNKRHKDEEKLKKGLSSSSKAKKRKKKKSKKKHEKSKEKGGNLLSKIA